MQIILKNLDEQNVKKVKNKIDLIITRIYIIKNGSIRRLIRKNGKI